LASTGPATALAALAELAELAEFLAEVLEESSEIPADRLVEAAEFLAETTCRLDHQALD
jgi:hypothetical protein